MNHEQQIDEAVEGWKIILGQLARTPQEAQSIRDRLDAIGHYLKSNISALRDDYSKAALEALISKLYYEKSNG